MNFSFIFFIILTGLAFRLRGIWGHQLGGGIFGLFLGFGVILTLSLPFESSWLMIFCLMIIYSLASFFGWFKKKGLVRFLTGYFIYGMFPNIMLSVFLFRNSMTSILELIFLGAFGMGFGFWISTFLLTHVRNMIKKKYESKNTNALELVFDKIKSNREASHIYFTKFNTWTYLMEIPSGILYGISTMIALNSNRSYVNYLDLTGIIQDIAVFLIFGPFLASLFISGYKKRVDINPNKPSFNQIRWSSPKFIKSSFITGLIFIVLSLVMMFFWKFLDIKILFLILLWLIIIAARFCCENDSKMMKIDLKFDFICGFIISFLCFLSF